jgi:peptidoglycan-associated lipoprotein
MRLKVLSLLAAVVLVAACESTPQDQGSAAGAAAAVKPGPTPGTQEDLVVNVGDRVFFGFDKSDLTPEARATLDRQAAWLNQYPRVTISIEGHADERGTREYNLALGERRADAVKKYLTARGVDANRVATISYGKERPQVLGSNEAAWAQNRRGVTVVN